MVTEEDVAESNRPGAKPPGHNAKGSVSRRFADAGAAANEIFDGYNDWSGTVSSHSLEASYALIAANWAVYGNKSAILASLWARWSLGIVITFLAVNLLLATLMTRLYVKRCKYADDDKDRWDEEFKNAANAPSAWPYTDGIQTLGTVKEFASVIAPVTAGVIFVVGLVCGGP